MAHIRAQIRDAAVAALAGLGATVKSTRFAPTNASQLPRFHVYTVSENVVGGTLDKQIRVLSLAVEVIATGHEETLDDTLDDFAVSIETALENNTLGGLCYGLALTTTDMTVESGKEAPIGGERLTFEAKYRSVMAAPTVSV